MIDDPEIPKVGVVPLDAQTAQWRVWAPRARRVELVLGLGDQALRLPMEAEPRGYHSRTTPIPDPGQRYAYALDGGLPLPDPCARWQPDGINQPSAVWFPERFVWEEGDWAGIERSDLVFYEVHVGTFTREGTFDAVIPRLPALRELGITALELMPVGQFPGTRSWGYDLVHPFAPQDSYGGPAGLHRLVQACHRLGLAVFLDAIYNHFGPEGNYFSAFGFYLNDRYRTDWGPALNYDGVECDAVRAMVLENARSWVRDYHFDGLRLDAADQIYDMSPSPILAEIAAVVHLEARRLGRPAYVFSETDLNNAHRFLADPALCGFGHDGHWNDDFHHAAHAVLTGESQGYYSDFAAAGASGLAKVYFDVFVNNGVYSPFRRRRHGASGTEFPGDRYVAFVQNHDQVGNRLTSDRYAASLPGSAVRLAAGILLLAPRLPLLFMGEEYGETNPFPFFCDFQSPELIEAVRKGRKAEFSYFGWEEEPPDPMSAATRDAAVLSWTWDDPQRAGLRRLYRDLLRFRRESPTLRDFRHARTRLLTEVGTSDVLEVIRGGSEISPELRIYFNLSGEVRELPADQAAELPAFRSERPEYGAKALEEDRRSPRLLPHEFQVFGPLTGS